MKLGIGFVNYNAETPTYTWNVDVKISDFKNKIIEDLELDENAYIDVKFLKRSTYDEEPAIAFNIDAYLLRITEHGKTYNVMMRCHSHIGDPVMMVYYLHI